ncbi:MBL fold metallo-hydrolase [Pseudoalteromonas obscura]|uniref:MBL fold metallo-hydrolase n=1 Tax=Pseudoalteromonas obscura TaxID=3048491 RepID=A0ABT7EKG2_9GAMM|nr:MBL fold metallo-hydrolase [Pseudoalteromonas sp. P94(2023)]MDK2595520.1 MBL fold metallo-hydrolase [Pseudoalteromonas sp. P94(2023)]
MVSNLDAQVNEAGYYSTQFKAGKFHNSNETEQPNMRKTLGIFWRYISETKQSPVPSKPLPMVQQSTSMLTQLSDTQIHMIKLGHSSVLLKVYGKYWLLDPVFSKRASPFSFAGPERFQDTPISLEDLPPIERILISHNHYDHLDKDSVLALIDKTKEIFVPLGVEGDLKQWGVDDTKIKAFDWWQEHTDNNSLVSFVPTQHFSGRGLGDSNKTLWGSWVIKAGDQSIYFSGDSGYFDGFKEIGRRYGPFNYTFIETGAYDKDWADIHMTPEQSVQAHLDLNGEVMFPIHNGTFDLAFHSWYDPLERVSKAAEHEQVTINTPIVGEVITAGTPHNNAFWWKSLMSKG